MATQPEPLILWGGGGHALVVADLVRLDPRFNLAGYLSDSGPSTKPGFACTPYLGGGADLPVIRRRGFARLVVAVGDNAPRLALAGLAVEAGFELATLIHPRAVVAADAQIGPGSVLMAGAVVNPAASIGANVVINTSASVDHECRIADGASVCPGARLAGGVAVGRLAWIGIGAVVRENLTIGDRAVLGAGAVAVESIPPDCVAVGVPARVVRRREQHLDAH
jgi:sugar O-acyltransferase (sialic acid O-acetyltransferase NeuD family)